MEKVRCIETIANMMDKDNLIIYLGNNISLDGQVNKAVLLVTHDFTRTGAPTVLLEMAKIFLEQGCSVWCLCDKEDALMEQYIELGVNVIIYEEYKNDSRWLWQIRNVFDLWCLNTLILFDMFEKLNNTSQNVLWWIHENEHHFKLFDSKIRNMKVGMNSKILAAGPCVKKMIKKYMGVEAEILNFGIEDTGVNVKVRKKDDKIKFLQVGTIDGNKGQGVLVDAIELLDEEIMRKTEFIFCGNRENAVGRELFKIDRAISRFNNVNLIPALERNDLYRLYNEIDAIIVPSKEETTSAIMVEAMMKGIPGICSDGCGITYYMENGRNGFIFKRQNIEELANKITYVVNNIDKMSAVKKAARKVYEEVYSINVFEKTIKTLLKWAEENGKLSKETVLNNVNACSGCGACMLKCPVSAITMADNERGFLYPNIDNEKCIRCGKCLEVCAADYDMEQNPMQQEIYALKVKDEQKRMESQSGGAFAIMAEKVLDMGGIVYGAGFADNLEVVYMRVSEKEELFRLKGSKYVQAKTGNIYEQVKQDLYEGRKVLFSGTACHVDGLKHYIGKDMEHNLITCDIVCHGVPSPKVYRDYLHYIEGENGKVTKFDFRDKSYMGWHKQVERYDTEEGKVRVSDDYTSIFYTNYCLRESCYVCKYADFNRISDVTVADFWGVENVYPDMDDDKGVSLMLINSPKGKELFEIIKPDIEYRSVEKEQCKQHNLLEPTVRPKETMEFWADYYDKDFRYILRKYAQKRMAVIGNMTVLSNWINMIKENVKLSSYFINSNKRNVAVCGDAKNSQLLIDNLVKDSVCITAIIDMYQEYKDNETAGIAIINVKEFVDKYLTNTDVIVITDETHCVDMMEALVKVGIPLSKIMPMSFITTLEV